MSYKIPVLTTGEIYHIYNRSLQKIPIFGQRRNCLHFLDSIEYYLQNNPPVKFSKFCENKSKYKIDLQNPIATLITFNLMPNHFHFILRQEKENGILKFMQKTENSFSHYFNIRNENKGPLFESTFRAVHVGSDEQLLHLSRYIHLNPVTAFLVNKPEDYEFSSYNYYLGKTKSNMIDSSVVIDQFKSIADYQTFVNNRIDYQRKLARIRDLLLEEF